MLEDVSHIPYWDISTLRLVIGGHALDTDQTMSDLNCQLENFSKRGSFYVLERVTRFVLTIARYRPLHGSSYIKTPRFLVWKRCFVNIRNNDQKCFLYSVLSALHEPQKNKERLSNYVPYLNT